MNTLAENVYIIETPLQLLSAFEAQNYFKLQNNHLLIHVGGTGYSVERFQAILKEQVWDDVRYINFKAESFEFKSKIFGEMLLSKIRGLFYDYQKWQNKKIIEDLVHQYSSIKNVFIGNYLAGYQEYMRHFANKLDHNNLYLLDDGTDVLVINEERKDLHNNRKVADGITNDKSLKTVIRDTKSAIRKKLFDWDAKDAESITFFSAYDLEPNGKDKYFKNEFENLRTLATKVIPSQDIVFIGQCFVEDDCFLEEEYLHYLSKVKNYFAGEKLVYIPHPRESVHMINKINKTHGFEIRRLMTPIEFEVSLGGLTPKILATFFSSALVNCQLILRSQVEFKAFYLPPENMNCYRELSSCVYQYFQDKCDENIELVRNY